MKPHSPCPGRRGLSSLRPFDNFFKYVYLKRHQKRTYHLKSCRDCQALQSGLVCFANTFDSDHQKKYETTQSTPGGLSSLRPFSITWQFSNEYHITLNGNSHQFSIVDVRSILNQFIINNKSKQHQY